ncbi:calcium/sodium antiporter [Parahaliea sp. F7430]|uniref:Calcium/sodium antiporter n=1 Tax=Sediminihaliea albiluteola TaxID=2758564 RepID=A0A7W2TY94_9GAMM|nr:calcium/sodium antiporter [Sediminihaliea albiluteola]MBA6414175.1 calcium/sodium antiporter [Sediminihaliea albiluteola]
MITALLAVLAGLALLLWSADKFVDSAASVAAYYGMPPLLIGMVILGFGTSAPEMLVSGIAAVQGNPGLALGNAYGSNITNIALVLGLTALISPIAVQSNILRKELPVLTAITGLAIFQLLDGELSRIDAIVLLLVFAALMSWTIFQGMRSPSDSFSQELEQDLPSRVMSQRSAWIWLIVGLLVLIASSRLLVWGAIDMAQAFGVSDLIIGLTVVAIGTSLPELMSSIIAARKGEHDMALGNVLGSNMFNTLAVVGIAGLIQPFAVEPVILSRDVMVMTALTVSLFVIGYSFRPGSRRINRVEGAILLSSFCAYCSYLILTYLTPSALGA